MPYLKKQAPFPEPIDCRILTAALNLFVTKGYYNVSIHEIQALSDVSIGSIYRHFGGKEGLAKALYTHILNEVDELIEGVIKSVHSPVEQIEEIIKQFFEHTETHPEIIAFIFHTKHAEFLPNEPLLWESAPFLKLKKITIKASDIGAINNIESAVTTSIIYGSISNLIQSHLDGLLENPPIEYLNTILDGIWSGLRKC